MRKAGCSVSEFWIRTRLRGQPGDFWCHCMMSVLLIVFSWNGTSLQLDNKRHGPANYQPPHPARPCYRILGVSTHHQTPTQLTCSLLFSPNIDFTFSVKLLFVEVCLFSFCWFFWCFFQEASIGVERRNRQSQRRKNRSCSLLTCRLGHRLSLHYEGN